MQVTLAQAALLFLLLDAASCFQPSAFLFAKQPRASVRSQRFSFRLSAAGDGNKNNAEQEAQRWAEAAKKMQEERGRVSDSPQASELEGKVLPAPAAGELEALMQKAEAFKAKQAGGGQAGGEGDVLPARYRGGSSSTAPQRLVGGDAGSLRQAAPYKPGESKAGAIQEGWTPDQIEQMLEEEAKWKQQLEAKKEEERAAGALASDADKFRIGNDMTAEKGVPSSMESAVMQALLSSLSVMKRGCGRLRLDVDTTGGDETYTTLKNSIPFTRVFSKALTVNGFSTVHIIMPDVGASALAKRDWAGADGFKVSAFERSGLPNLVETDDCVVVVAPAASEIDQLRRLSERAAELGLPVVLVNPSVKSPGGENLGSLGSYALGLSDFLRSFEPAYHLRTLSWGLILRMFPGNWEVFQLDPRGSYVKIKECDTMPIGEALEEIYNEANPSKGDGLGSLARGLGSFLGKYSKG
uniref:DUF1995 domain-containing protein n=1 Tax=Guillardia theta TaxID=55529 RepID=A0A7S4N837_GUITH|mmetsp:Transcript_1800/g.5470  ORF Transcript_1800/g.5470 Transcript_1800/m.5470 type:complete len:468 (+) Transcript_1800:60-1463(+)